MKKALLIGRLDTDDSHVLGIYKVEGGYEAVELVEDDGEMYSTGEYTSLPALLRSLIEDVDSSPTDSGSS
jgi:hypothetical protein